jgi:hypothetical protein
MLAIDLTGDLGLRLSSELRIPSGVIRGVVLPTSFCPTPACRRETSFTSSTRNRLSEGPARRRESAQEPGNPVVLQRDYGLMYVSFEME